MPELPADFDLKLMPDWLKEPATKNPYADYEGRDEERRPRGRDDWGGGAGRGRGDERRGRPGGQRPGGGARPGGGPRDGARRDDRPRKDAPAGRKPDATGDKRTAGRADDRRGKPGENRRPDERDRPAQQPQTPPANVSIEFFPDENCAQSIARQVKSTHRAYSLFDLARMFLARPERHRLKITTKTVAEVLYQVGENGPVWTDRTAAERAAFPMMRSSYYVEVTEQREAPKGNFTNVARCRANGALLGPTSYHGYQPALRRLYDERFSRRMSYQDFLREIEVVNDPALVEQWKKQVSSATVYRLAPPTPVKEPKAAEEKSAAPAAEALTTETPAAEIPAAESAEEAVPEAPATEPVEAAAEAPEPEAAPEAHAAPYEGPVFNSLNDVEQHFKENYLPGLIRTGSSFHLSGEASRTLTDRGIAAAVRQAWEQERGFPGQMMHQLRQQFSRAGLQVFKHRKRMQFVSLIRPSPMENGSLSASVAEILQVIQGNATCNRASLAAAILGTDENAVDAARKSTLATDLRWLIETGRVIEFSDGRLELPLAPAKQEPGRPGAKTGDSTTTTTAETPVAESATVSEPTAETPAGVVVEEVVPEAARETATEPLPVEEALPANEPVEAEEPVGAISAESPSDQP